LHVAFTYRGIPSQLTDFEINANVDILLNWVLKYFSAGNEHRKDATINQALRTARPVIVTEKMPLILQHAGHSRTIVGCEQVKGGSINLLVFDPSRRVSSDIRKAGLAAYSGVNGDETPNTAFLSTSNLFHQVASSMKTYDTPKRKADSSSAGSSIKRVRSSTDENRPRNEPIVVDDDDDVEVVEVKSSAGELSHTSVLAAFRLTAQKLGKKDKYQILSFPLDPPWEETERSNRREVLSIKVK